VTTHRTTRRSPDSASQSRVVASDDAPMPRWSVHLMRARYRNRRYAGYAERRTLTLFVSFWRLRLEIGTR
jgi:hypothetical protein